MALSQDAKTDSTLIFRLARRFLYVSNYQRSEVEVKALSNVDSGIRSEGLKQNFIKSYHRNVFDAHKKNEWHMNLYIYYHDNQRLTLLWRIDVFCTERFPLLLQGGRKKIRKFPSGIRLTWKKMLLKLLIIPVILFIL